MTSVANSQEKRKAVGVRIEELLSLLNSSKTFLKANLGLIKSVYLAPLTEHCTRKKLPTKENVKKDVLPKKSETTNPDKNPEEFLGNVIANMSFWNDENQSPRGIQSDQKITFAELAALNRLSTLSSLLKTLINIVERLTKGLLAASTVLEHSQKQIEDVLSYAVVLVKCSCCLSEIFQLPSISLDACESSVQRYLSNVTTYESKECATFSISEVTNYIPRLEAQINHLRTIVFLIGSYIVSIIQTCLCVVDTKLLEVEVREVMTIITNLPPMYLRTKKLSHLSTIASDLLENVPPNKRQYPLAPKSAKEIKEISTGSDYESKKTTKAFQRKYGKFPNSDVR